MRLWSIHPRYLDPAGLVALWREGLLAQAVLAAKTRGYTKHPQLDRFREHRRPLAAIATYLAEVQSEAARRGYAFDRTKLHASRTRRPVAVTDGQLSFEWQHLGAKLKQRNREWFRRMKPIAAPEPHPLFVVIPGDVAAWERASS